MNFMDSYTANDTIHGGDISDDGQNAILMDNGNDDNAHFLERDGSDWNHVETRSGDGRGRAAFWGQNYVGHGDISGSLYIYDDDLNEIADSPFQGVSDIRAMTTQDDRHVIYAVGDDFTLYEVDYSDESDVHISRQADIAENRVHTVSSSENYIICGDGGGFIAIYEIETFNQVDNWSASTTVEGSAITDDFAVAGDSTDARLLEPDPWSETNDSPYSAGGTIETVSIAPDQTHVLLGYSSDNHEIINYDDLTVEETLTESGDGGLASTFTQDYMFVSSDDEALFYEHEYGILLEGSVIVDGTPVEDAEVIVTENEQFTGRTFTDSNGDFEMPLTSGENVHVMTHDGDVTFKSKPFIDAS